MISVIIMYTRIKSRGFTLIELLVVMTIIAVMICIAAPCAKSGNKRNVVLNEALNVRELVYSGIEVARTSGTTVRLVISCLDRAYWLEKARDQEQSDFERLEGFLGVSHYYDIAIDDLATEGLAVDEMADYFLIDPSKPLPSNTKIRFSSLNVWAEVNVNKNSVEVKEGEY